MLPWEWTRANFPAVAQVLDRLASEPGRDVDLARLLHGMHSAMRDPRALMLVATEIADHGADWGLPASGQRDHPGTRFARHNLPLRQVRLGLVAPDSYGDSPFTGDVGVDHDVLRTSLLVVGPPGSGKTRGLAIPIIEHLSLSSLARMASVVVIDPKGTDFDFEGWFDITLDARAPTCGFDLFGGSPTADIAADRLASALLPPRVSDDKVYFVDASRNALYACLAPFHEAFGRWPAIPELAALLRADQSAMDRVKSALKGPAAKEQRTLLDSRRTQTRARVDPAASLVERFGLLDRPALRRLFDRPEPRFTMRDIDRPIRVRVVLPEAEYPDASLILARLVVSQFVQAVSAGSADRSVFKALVMDEAGRFVDDYVARGVQRLRSHNAGLVLLTQSLADFPPGVRDTVFGSAGCKAVFGGVDPADAERFSTWFGEKQTPETVRTRGRQVTLGPSGYTCGESRATSIRRIERARWSVSDIITGIPAGHSLVSLARSTGQRVGPVLVNLRG